MEVVFQSMPWALLSQLPKCTAEAGSVMTSGGASTSMATNPKLGFPNKSNEGPFKVVVAFSQNVIVLKSILLIEDDEFCPNFA